MAIISDWPESDSRIRTAEHSNYNMLDKIEILIKAADSEKFYQILINKGQIILWSKSGSIVRNQLHDEFVIHEELSLSIQISGNHSKYRWNLNTESVDTTSLIFIQWSNFGCFFSDCHLFRVNKLWKKRRKKLAFVFRVSRATAASE